MNAKAIFRVSIAAAGFLLSAACYDDPVALTESEHPSPVEEVPMETAASSVGTSGITVFDNFQPRFKVDFSVSGSMTPNSTVTVTLAGEAVEDLTGGTVTVILPTMASMDYAGADKRPYYPAGQSLPVVRSWTLQAMSAGDTWQQSFSVVLPGEGYYHLAVAVDANAPVGADDPYVVGEDLYFERWMLVLATGGRLTTGFDESLFAEGIAPVPGPFRNKVGHRTTGTGATAAADGDFGMMYSSSSPVRLSVTYLGLTWTVTAAQGARVNATLWEGSGPDVEQVRTYTATVGSTGIVTFPCPASNQWLSGVIRLPGNASVVEQVFIGYWDAHPSDCGDTQSEQGPRTVYIPWDHLSEVGPRIRSHFNVSPPAIDFSVNLSGQARSYYSASDHSIVFASTYVNKWTAAHEFAHGVHEKSLGGLWPVESSCQYHTIWGDYGYGCALLEGFADYAAQHGANWSMTYFDYPTDDNPSPRVEGWIAALFRDLIDSTTDGDDNTNYTASSIATAFKTCEVKHNGNWFGINEVSDFVWCLEDQVVTSVHNDHFPGITAPSDARATRGSGWSASDIRDTWLQNLTDGS